MDIIEKLQWRYATKKFNDRALIAKEKINIIKEAFNLTATSYGLQPIKLLIISNKELQKNWLNTQWSKSKWHKHLIY